MKKLATDSFLRLKKHCENENYKGWDPYDGLNSKVFQATPLKHWPLARLAWIQLFKRNPVNLRKPLLVPKGYNPKALGLFLSGYCNLYRIAESGNETFGTKEELADTIQHLAGKLLGLQTKGYSGACWGYNFDWQSKAFFLPDKTPTVVVTSFVVNALIDAYHCINRQEYLDTAISSAKFVLNDLNRIKKPQELYMFSYSPLDRRAVYNATLLGTKILSFAYKYTKQSEYKDAAYKSAKAVCLTQKDNGAFIHSDQVGDKWRDNFHTGFKIESLAIYQDYCNDFSFKGNIEKGLSYWLKNFFLEDGTAKYYDDQVYPIDLHCHAQAIVTLVKSGSYKTNKYIIDKVIKKSINEMQGKDGYFYFQRTRKYLNKIEYIRWPNAWMFYGLSYWLKINDV